jgi:methylenetetrahydrofolate dehydrogenase (NADP+)/methenyltetrahydrofolate cyclohydrolase
VSRGDVALETRILKGKPIAQGIKEDVARRVSALERDGVPVVLSIVLVGDDHGSKMYSRSIEKAATGVGVRAALTALPAETGAEEVARTIRGLSESPEVGGIIVQQPLPSGVPASVVEEIAPGKDIDGATTLSMGLLMSGREAFAPATALGVIEILAGYDVPVTGRHVVIVGRSTVVGKPLANLLLRKTERGNATVTVCHTGTMDLTAHTRDADILVAAMGAPEAITADMISEGAVVVDVGTNWIEDPSSERGGRTVGDVAFEEMLGRASAVTPVPGGVGSLTTAILLRNTVEAVERSRS